MRKILVLIPSGEIYHHDCVRAYNHDQVAVTLDRYYNLGDLFVFDSSLKLLQYDVIETMVIAECSPERIARYNAEFDYCFLRGSNYLHPYMDWEQAEEVLKQLRIPVIPFGIGAQSPSGGPLKLSESTQRVMRLIADSCASVGVRGAYTAEVLSKMGIQNIDIIGCPSIYRHNQPSMEIHLQPLEAIKRVAFSLRREVDTNYTTDPKRYLDFQRHLILQLDQRFLLTVMAQGEIEEKIIYYRDSDRMSLAIHSLTESKWIADMEDPLLRLYKDQMFFSEKVEDYDRFVRTQDLMVGFRLHGNVMALASGIPTIACVYDSRTREYAETMGIPAHDIDSGVPFRLEDYYSQERFNLFNKHYRHYYGVMRDFLTKNGMAHKMQILNKAA